VLPVLVVGLRDPKLRLFRVVAERILVEQLLVLTDGALVVLVRKRIARFLVVLVGAELGLRAARGEREQGNEGDRDTDRHRLSSREVVHVTEAWGGRNSRGFDRRRTTSAPRL